MTTGILSRVLVVLVLLHSAWAQALDERQRERLTASVMSQNLPLEKRIAALKVLYADQLEDGKIIRSFCVWDMLGKAGPVYGTVDDQKLRSLHYGLALDVVAYQNEDALLNDLRSGQCDAALMSGSRVGEFNRFAATIEALGAVPDITHLQMLMQVVASPRMADQLEGNGYVVLGVGSLGEHYAFSNEAGIDRLSQWKGRKVAVPVGDASLQALAAQLGADVTLGEQLAVVQTFSAHDSAGMLSPLVAFYAAGAGQASEHTAILNYPLSQSTIQLIGREERFPTGLAQILREDFLFKFDHYVKRVERERSNLKASLWRDVPRIEQSALEQQLQAVRLKLRDQGVYDAQMLKFQRKIRCRIDPQRSECANPLE